MIRGYSDQAKPVFRKYIDVSDVNIFIFCPYKLYLVKYIGLRSKDTFKSILGKILHKAYLTATHLYARDFSLNSARKMVLKDISRELHDSPNIDRIKEYVDKVIGYRYSIPLFSKNVKTELYIRSEKLCLKGHIDLLEGFNPIEVKFRRDVKFSDLIQLTLYVFILEEKYGIDIDYGYIDLLEKGVRKKFFINDEIRVKALKYRERIQVAEITGIFPRVRGNCSGCDLRNECRLMFY